MAVNVSFWSGFAKRKNSTKQPAGAGTTHACLLKEASSIEEPTFILATGNPENYTYCSAYGNYYYITLKEYVPPHWHIYCELDPMATYKSAIGGSSLYVTRSYSGFWNERLVDSVPIMCNTVNDRVGRRGDNPVPFPNQSGCFVVTVPAQMGTSGNDGATHHVMTPSQYAVFSKNFYATNAYMDVGGWGAISPETKALMQPENYIKDIRWYPFEYSELCASGAQPHKIVINGWDTNCYGYYLTDGKIIHGGSIFDIPKHPQSDTLGQYLNTSGFGTMTLYDPFAGVFSIDPNSVASSDEIWVDYYIDPSCGQGLFFATAISHGGNEDALIAATSMEFGVPVLFSSRTSGTLVTAVKEAIKGNPIGAIGSMYDTQLNPKLQTIGSVASKATYRQMPYLYAEFNEIVPIDRSLVGYPCCRTLQINTLNGFVQCQTGDINVSCPPVYKAQIKTYLEGGFFYE